MTVVDSAQAQETTVTDKQPMQADGGKSARQRDKTTPKGPESAGGAYPNPHDQESDEFEGGQSDNRYRGPPNPNATTE